MDSRLVQRLQQHISEDITQSTKTEYMKVEDDLRLSPDWPPKSSPDLDIIELQKQDNALLDAAAVVKPEKGEGQDNEAFVADDVIVTKGPANGVTSSGQRQTTVTVANGNGQLTDVSVH